MSSEETKENKEKELERKKDKKNPLELILGESRKW